MAKSIECGGFLTDRFCLRVFKRGDFLPFFCNLKC